MIKESENLYERYKKKYDSNFPVNFNGNAFPIAVGFHNKYKEAFAAVSTSMSDKAKIDVAVKEANSNTESLEKAAKDMQDYFIGKVFAYDKRALR